MDVELVGTRILSDVFNLRFYVGLDLAAIESRCSGYAVIVCGDFCILRFSKCLYSDDEILDEVSQLGSVDDVVISIDAPFTMGSGMRDVDRKMVSMGFKVFPPGFSYMRTLTMRAERLVREFRLRGFINVYETHPRSALLSSRCRSAEEVLERLGIYSNVELSTLREDIRDAVIAATVSYCVDRSCCISVEGVDGVITLLSNICSDR